MQQKNNTHKKQIVLLLILIAIFVSSFYLNNGEEESKEEIVQEVHILEEKPKTESKQEGEAKEVPKEEDPRRNQGLETTIINIKGLQIEAEKAITQAEQTTGLSYRKTPLRDGQGMLFIFQADANHGIHMPNMHFAIDIVWITKEKRIVHIEENITPETYPEIFSSPEKARYVLELPAGYIQRSNIAIGDIADWQENPIEIY